MPKRNDHLLTLLTIAPWWVSILLSSLVYVSLTNLVPHFLGQDSIALEALADASRSIVIYLTLILLLPVPFLLLQRYNVINRLFLTCGF